MSAGFTNRIFYTGSEAIAICEALRSMPNPPTGDGADVSGWGNASNGYHAEFELTVLAGSTCELAAGAMLVAEEVFDTFPEESQAVTLTNATEIVNYTAHGFQTGDGPVRLSGTLPAQLDDATEYYVIRVDADDLKLAASRSDALAGTDVEFGSDGADVVLHWVTGVKSLTVAATAITDADDSFTKAGHGFTTGQRVQVANSGGALPTGLTANTDYFIIVLTSSTFQFAASAEDAAAGTEVTWTGGSGTQSVIYNTYAATSATVYTKFAVLNGGDAISLTEDIGYRERIAHRPGVVAYHLVASQSSSGYSPITAYVRAIRYVG